MNVSLRIKELRELKNLSKGAFADMIKIDRSQFTKIEGEKLTPTIAQLMEISSIFNISIDWLLTGDGDMYKVSEGIKEQIRTLPRSVPLIPIEAVAGFPSDDNEGVTYADCDQYSIPEFDQRGYEFVIRVSGSSMYPKYSNGDILACKKIYDILFFQWGKVYVIDSSQGALVKRVFEDNQNPDNILLVSDNKENYPPFSIPKSDIRSLSIVLGVIRME